MATLHAASGATLLEPTQLPSPSNNNIHIPSASLFESVNALRQSISPTSSLRPSTPTDPLSPLQTPTTSPRLDKYSASPIDGKGSPRHVPLLRPQRSTPHFSRPATQNLPSTPDAGRSPKDRLHAFLSPSPQKPALKTVASPSQSDIQYSPTHTPPESPANRSRKFGNILSRANTDPPSPSPLSKSSAMTMVDSDTARNSSQESLKSSLSSTVPTPRPLMKTSHSFSSTRETGTVNSVNAAHLIASAGSAEAAIQILLQEKQALVVRNEQLWKLAENQRSMVLDLSRDLQYALKDKERYRQQLNDQMASEADAHLAEPRNATPKTIERRKSPVPKDDGTKEASGSADDDLHAKGENEKSVSNRSSGDSASIASSMREYGFPTPPKSKQYRLHETSDVFVSPLQRISSLKLRGEAAIVTPEKSRLRNISSPLNVSSLSSNNPFRKAAPPPLNLKPAKLGYRQTQAEDNEHSESDYDALEDDGHMREERGRRKTRGERDREYEREASKENRPQRENEVRRPSIGKRSRSDPVRGHASRQLEEKRGFPAGLMAGMGLPSSPRALLLGGLQSPLPQPLGSIASNVRPPNHTLPTAVQYLADARSSNFPGLPMSPRPCDRPVNSPMPRLPDASGSSPDFTHSEVSSIPPPSRNIQPLREPTIVKRETGTHMPSASHSSLLSSQPNGERPNLSRIQSCQEGQVFKGFCLYGYPDLVLPPNALPFVQVKVHSSRLTPSRQNSKRGRSSDDEAVFQLAVHARADGTQLWRVEKTLAALPLLDQSFKSKCTFTVPVPEKALFSGHSPMKVDARRAALNSYFESMLEMPMDQRAALVLSDFFSTDVIGPELNYSELASANESPSSSSMKTDFRRRKEGFLAKKGKQWGSWKARYFVVDRSELRYYDGPDAELLGVIKLSGAQLARQSEDDTADYRHAFLVLEPKRKDPNQTVRHVLCCESDEQRDEWIDAILPHTEAPNDESSFGTPNTSYRPSLEVAKASSSELRAVHYEDTVAAHAPTVGDIPIGKLPNSSPPLPFEDVSRTTTPQSINGATTQNTKSMKDSRKRSFFGFRSKGIEEPVALPARPPHASSPSQQSISGRQIPSTGVFGIPLAEAVRTAALRGAERCLPAPVYRCMEYLEKTGAIEEEGIFRMSGSSRVIKELRERFNKEGDVKLLEGEFYDVHAVASVLKLFLRELPEPVLTKELHLDFLRVAEMPDERQKIDTINALAHKLPEVNFELIAALSRFLLHIVSNAEVNKMTVRNVGIVFAPTLNVPGTLIHAFLQNFESIFGRSISSASYSPFVQQSTNASVSDDFASDEIRSPRKQMFSELSTPGPYQTTFNPLSSSQASRPALPPAFVPLQTQYEGTQTKQDSQHQHHHQQQYSPPPTHASAVNSNAYGSLNAAMCESPSSTNNKTTPITLRKARPEDAGRMTSSPGSSPQLEGKKKSGMSMTRLREFASREGI